MVLVVLDDVGRSAWSTFGGAISTPSQDRLARAGLGCTRCHSTAVCSPFRSAPLTGRISHPARTGVVMETGPGYPGVDTAMGRVTATVAEVLKQRGRQP